MMRYFFGLFALYCFLKMSQIGLTFSESEWSFIVYAIIFLISTTFSRHASTFTASPSESERVPWHNYIGVIGVVGVYVVATTHFGINNDVLVVYLLVSDYISTYSVDVFFPTEKEQHESSPNV